MTMKKLICTAAAALLMSAAFPAVPAAADDLGGDAADNAVFEYMIENGEASVTGYTGSDMELVIPDTLGDCPVTAVSENAFMGSSDIVSLVIPDSVRTIGARALSGCPWLCSITIGSGVAEIGDYAFTACPELSEIKVSEDNPTYTAVNGSLYDKNDTLLIYAGAGIAEIAAFTKAIGKAAFFGRTDLYSVSIPKGVTAIGDYAFSGCMYLRSVELPDSVSELGKGCFMSCSSLMSFTPGNSIKNIPESCFYSCTSLSDITIPESLTAIGDRAFYGCGELSGVLIPDTVKTFGTDSLGRHYDIRSGASENIPGFIIKGETGTAAHEYARSYGIFYSQTDLAKGDVNGDGFIDAVDASAVLAEYAVSSTGGKPSFTEEQFAAADWNEDGIADAVDASCILEEYARLQTS